MQSQQPKLKEIDSKEFQAAYDEIARYYTPVKVRNLTPGSVLPCDLYLPSLSENKKQLILEELLPEGTVYEESLHSLLTGEEVLEVYVKKEKEDAFFNYLNLHIQKIIRSPEVPPEMKTELLYDNAESIVRKVFNERPTPSNIKLGLQFAENFATHISIDKIGVDALFSLFSKDYYTFTHSVQVAILGMSFCKSLGWTHDDVKSFGLGALFHDIGKNTIDEAILNKPSKLDREEFEIIKKHSVLGYQQLKDAQLISRDQLAVVLHHHEAADGSGYPRGLKGQDIHRFARVAHIVDVYDALTTKRPYKDALPSDRATKIMGEEMKASFDPSLLHAFIEFLGMEVTATRPSSGKRMLIDLGNQMMIQFDHDASRVKATLVGLETSEYLILRVPGLLQLQKKIQPGKEIIGRYAHCGIVYGFKANILGHIFHPLRLLFLSYPRVVENINLRKNPRIDCLLPGEATVRGKTCPGIITDLSEGGCKFLLKQSDVSFLPETIPDETVALKVHLIGEIKADDIAGKLRSVSLNVGEGKASLGIQFTDLCLETKEHLQTYIQNVLNLVR